MSKPRIFIASSTEHIKSAHAIHMFLNNSYAHTKLWETAVEPGDYTLPALIKTFEDYDYGIFVFAADDIIKIREKNYEIVRDNVLFEFGLFIGKNGLENAFIICPQTYLKGGRIPSDLFGITVSTFDSDRPKEELQDAVSSSCLKILSKIESQQVQEENLSISNTNSYYGICSHESHMYTEIVRMLSHAQKNIILVFTNVERLMVFDLFISLINSRINGVSIDVHYYPQIDKDVNSYSIEILRQIGCNIKVYDVGSYPKTGVVFMSDPERDDSSKMIVKTESLARKNVYAYIYKGVIHNVSIRAIYSQIEVLDRDSEVYTPTLVDIDIKEICEYFNRVPLYKQNKCSFTIEPIVANRTHPQSDNVVREFKLEQIEILDNLYRNHGFKLYEPKAILLQNGVKHLMTPPVLEEQNGHLLVAEGHTRLFKYSRVDTEIICLIVRGMSEPLMSPPTEWKNINISTQDIIKMRTSNLTDLQRARRVETHVHSGTWYE